jgi:chromate transporter
VVAGVLFVLPSLLILIGLGWIYLAYGHLPAISGVLYGIKPAVTAIVLFAAYRIGSRALQNWLLWSLAGLAFLAIFIFDMPFPLIVLSAVIFGALGGKLAPAKFKMGGGHGTAQKSYGPALIDDQTPTPDHALFSWLRLVKVLLFGLLLWGGAIGFLYSQYGWNGALTQIANLWWCLCGFALCLSGRG